MSSLRGWGDTAGVHPPPREINEHIPSVGSEGLPVAFSWDIQHIAFSVLSLTDSEV